MTIVDYVQSVKSLRDDYSEEIPSTILHSTHQDGGPKFKVRKAWFQCVSGVLAEGIKKGYLPREYIETYHEFHHRVRETGFHDRDTNREDITHANQILDDIITELSRNA